MAFNSGNVATFSLGGTDISAFTTSVKVDIKRDVKAIKPIGGSATTNLVGAYDGTITLDGGWDPTLDALISPLMLAATPATSAFSHKPAGAGGRTIAGNAYVADYSVTTPGDDTAKWSCTLAVAGTITDS
jgi:hypothetical protein